MAKKRSEKQEKMAQARKEKRRAAARVQERKRRRKKITITVAILTALAAAITGVTIWAVRTSPLTHLIPIKKTEHYSLNAAQMTFYAWQIYQQYLENATDSTQVPDTSIPFSAQNYDSDTTWEEYFRQASCEYADNVLTLCEAAKANDFTPDFDMREEVEYGLSMMDVSTVPDFVTQEDMLSAMELYLLAEGYYTYLNNTMTVSEEDMETYYTENAASMQVCSYMVFGFGYSDAGDGYLSADQAQELASELRRCTTPEEFEEWVVAYYMENSAMTEAEAEQSASALYNENSTYVEGDVVCEWAFSQEAEVGTTKIIDDTDSSTLMVCLLLSSPERDTSHPVNLRQVMLTASNYGSVEDAHSQAQQLLARWEEGEMTEDTFATMADTYSEDTTYSGGLYENVIIGDMTNSWKSWFQDPARQPGDVTILDNSYGAFIVYYVGESDTTAWEQTATNALLASQYETTYNQLETDADISTFSFAKGLIEVYESN